MSRKQTLQRLEERMTLGLESLGERMAHLEEVVGGRLYGVRDIRIFEVEKDENGEEVQDDNDKRDRLVDISWHIRWKPGAATVYTCADSDSGSDRPIDLSERVFHGPIFLDLDTRYGGRTFRVPVLGGTISDILSIIHEFYKLYEATDAEDGAEGEDGDGKYSMFGEDYFVGLRFVSPGIWQVLLENF